MIAPELVKQLQKLNQEERLEVIRLLQDDLVDGPSEREDLLTKPGQVLRVPSVRVNFNEARSFLEPQEEKLAEND